MRTALVVMIACVGLQSVEGHAFASDDPAPVGTIWEGTAKKFGPPNKQGNRITSADARIKVTARDGDDFVGELSFKNREFVWEIKGTITQPGGVKFTFSKLQHAPKNWESPGDLIDRVKFVGAVKDGKLKGKFEIPKNTGDGFRAGRFGELDLKLEE